MAIKIDLLPAYVQLRKKFHRTLAWCIAFTGLVAGGLLMALHQRKLELQTAQTNLVAAQAVAAKTTAAKSGAEKATADAAPYISAVNFMTGASKTGPQRAALIDLIRRAIDIDAVVSSIDVSNGQTVVIKATVRNPDEYARFLLNLRRASDTEGGTLFKGLPTATGPGGFANGAVPFQTPLPTGEIVPILYPVQVEAQGTLLNPVQLPTDPVGGAPAAGGAAGGPPPGVGTPPTTGTPAT